MAGGSAAMVVQDQCGGTRSNLVLPSGNGISWNAGLNTITDPQLKEQFASGNGYSAKVRKPYTITKQRERWTEEEHKKFLEALKLYGRAWRRIEEHVGTKTAVQIRSHAQKFFSKVVRESSASNINSVETIEIPPPRPKRKPMHPYPRKMVHPQNKKVPFPEQPLRSSSPNFSISEQENQSPTSVLSTVGSDALGSMDSSTPNSSLSPVSCAGGSHPADLTICEPNLIPGDDGSQSPAPVAAVHDEQSSKVQKLLFPKEIVIPEDRIVEETSTRSLKLFGRTVLVTECCGPSSEAIGNAKLFPSDSNDDKPVQPMPWNFMVTELQPENGECTSSQLPRAPPGPVYYLQFEKEKNTGDVGCAASMSWWALYGGLPFPFIPIHKQETVKVHSDSNGEEVQDGEIPKERSWTASNFGSVNEGENGDKHMGSETQSRQPNNDGIEQRGILELKPTGKSAPSNKCMKGFVPYKKRNAEGHGQSSTVTCEERNEQRIRLCL